MIFVGLSRGLDDLQHEATHNRRPGQAKPENVVATDGSVPAAVGGTALPRGELLQHLVELRLECIEATIDPVRATIDPIEAVVDEGQMRTLRVEFGLQRLHLPSG